MGYDVAVLGESRYIYDALGRRLKKTVTDTDGKEDVNYFGWDGDRHVHTERVRENGERYLTHIVYEPGSFTPLLHLSTTVTGAPQAQPHLLVQAHQLAVPADRRSDPGTVEALAMMETMMAGMPEGLRKMHEDSMRHLIENGLPPHMQAMMGETGQNTNKLLETIRQGLKEAKQPTTPVTVRYFACDHLGTPIALINQAGEIDWAARLDPWGNIQQEYNPHGIEQNIRMPGQYHDRETDLYYNRHRYYDRKIAGYINQDPIGLAGGINLYAYALNPAQWIDPWGLLIEFAPGSTPQFKAQAGEAIKYLNKGKASGNLAQLQKSKEKIYIQEISDGNDRYSPSKKTIYWDPKSALMCTNGTKQTPALGLGHEAEHALGDITGTTASTIPDGSPYNNLEEKRVISGWETRSAKSLSEGTRTDHGGSPYNVKCSTCII
jgi:RHS repeat-associated protein